MNPQDQTQADELWVNFVRHLIQTHSINPSLFEYNQCGCVTRFMEDSADQRALKLLDADIDINTFDDIDDISNWKYYDDYFSDANDFVRGYNKAKEEVRERLNLTKKGK